MKLTDFIVSAIIKKGILYEARNVDVEFKIPRSKTDQVDFQLEGITIHLKADHMTLEIEKDEKEGA